MKAKEFMKLAEKKADFRTANGKGWFSAEVVFEIIDKSKTVKQIKKKLEFLKYEPKGEL